MKLIELLELHDFRLYRTDLQTERAKENSNTIRIYLEYNEWFEFGFNDWFNCNEKMNNIRKILTKDILNRKVRSFQVNDEIEILEINLEVE